MANHRHILMAGLSVLALAFLSGCGGDDSSAELAMAPLETMPQQVQRAPKTVRQAYQFAVANPDVLQQLPCYCGCGGMGHTSNYSCYVSVARDGTSSFDGHALGCSICVDIALDAMRMTRENKDISQIRLYVDLAYGKYGPSNML